MPEHWLKLRPESGFDCLICARFTAAEELREIEREREIEHLAGRELAADDANVPRTVLSRRGFQSLFFTLITGPRRSLSLKLSDKYMSLKYEPESPVRRPTNRKVQFEGFVASQF